MPEYTNDLIHEKSPYLLQHAHNPVQWNAWNEESLQRALDEDKPIFLSIGYSTCHWCHVMERESFENPDIADVMNRYFINIKVDREERPDVDQTYMTAVQAMGQQGGWPLSAWLTPDLKPFFGGTYFPPQERYGRPGFREILERIHEVWETNREALRAQADGITDAIAGAMKVRKDPSGLSQDPVDKAYSLLSGIYDPVHGGFGQAPKFPRPVSLVFLLRYWHRTGEVNALHMVLHTLRRMALGGIHDQLGGGFARYSVDPYWRVPHFEKMLYDQAQLVWAYAQAYQITGLDDLADVASQACSYVQREMTAPEGFFFSAEDADSFDAEGRSREGAYYVWTSEEIDSVLGADAAEVVAFYYGFTPEGNFEHGENVLHVTHSISQTAEHTGKDPAEVRTILENSLTELYAQRAQRQRPGRDDKVLTSWNGLMISAFSVAYQALGAEGWMVSATRAADAILARQWDERTGVLLRRYRDGSSAIPGFLDDYAFLSLGLLDLYEASLKPEYMLHARKIAAAMIQRFWDEENGGFFFTTEGSQGVLGRRKDDYDGAEPSGNSIAAHVLLRLAEMTGDPDLFAKGERTVGAFSGHLSDSPETMPAMLCALDQVLHSPRQVVVSGERGVEGTETMIRMVQKAYLPDVTLLRADEGLFALSPWLQGMGTVDGKSAVYVCQNNACQAPTTDFEALRSALNPRPSPIPNE